ncbi:MAG: siderophore-interacting protein [Oxalobacteraceae bacterium]|nr:MAG: siderophore-interacting protein [Oxalobacteraceae bacterium]
MATTGALSRAVARMIARRATIIATEKLTDELVAITLEATGFRGVTWTPGEKVQIAMNSVFDTRTYTPIEWDADRGRTRILGFLHGIGPGCVWLRNAKVGDTCDVLGPRHSLNVCKLEGPIAFFGDETSMALAYALSRERGTFCFYHFEADDAGSTRLIAEQWGLDEVNVVARTAGESHLYKLEAALPSLAEKGATFILTGKAHTIQRLKVGLRGLDVPARRAISKAYWAPGKIGLD